MNTDVLIRRLYRLHGQKNDLERLHKGNEINFTYHAGYSLGYLKGKIDEIENILDELNASY